MNYNFALNTLKLSHQQSVKFDGIIVFVYNSENLIIDKIEIDATGKPKITIKINLE